MSIRRPDLGPAGSGELDNPEVPPGLGPGATGAVETADVPREPRDPVPLAEPVDPQPVAGGVRQPLGIGAYEPGAGGENAPFTGNPPTTERRRRQENPDRWVREERRVLPFEYPPSPEESPDASGSTRH